MICSCLCHKPISAHKWIGPSINSLFTQDPFIPRLTGADLVNEIEWYMLFIMACDNNTKKIGKTVFLSSYYCELFQAISTTINRQFVLTFGNNYTKQQDVTTKLSDKFFHNRFALCGSS